MKTHILVTADLNEEQQSLIADHLETGQSTVDFLPGPGSDQRSEVIRRADIILTLSPGGDLSDEELDMLGGARFMQLVSAGADHIPYRKIPGSITIASNPGAYAEPISEHAVAMALALAKRLPEEHRNLQEGEFNQFGKLNKSIRRSTVGILGFGGIGRAVARLFRAIGASIMGMNTSGRTGEPVDFIGTTDDLHHILSSSDIVVLSLPLKKDTRGLIGREQLGWMKDDAVFINVARGEIVDQQALYEHLKAHPEFRAGIESWWVEPLRHGRFELDYPFLELPNVLGAPHNSSMVPGALAHGLAEALKNIQRFLKGEPVRGEIDRSDFI